jgi:four helix bundle protein
VQDYKDLKVWQKAHNLTLKICKATETFPKSEVFNLVSQLRRAGASIPCNIAEDCGRNSNADFANFLRISLGSVNETEYLLLLAKELQYLTQELFDDLNQDVNEVKAMLISFIKKVRLTT